MLNRNRFQPQPNARQPADVRLTELRVEPWPDGKRVRVHVTLTPFLQNPNLDSVILDTAGEEVAHSSIIEIADVRFVFTMHIRSRPVGGFYVLTARLGYEDVGIVEERSISFKQKKRRTKPTHNNLAKVFMDRRWRFVILFMFLPWIAGCAAPSLAPSLIPSQTVEPSLTVTPTFTLSPSHTATPLSTTTPTPPLTFLLCSPLAGIELPELPQLMAGDIFQPPIPGRDDGHHGVDFAFYRRGSLTTMLGLPVQSIMPGKVAAVIQDRPPYGNAVIIETSLDPATARWPDTIKMPTRAPTVIPDPRLTCPPPGSEPWLNSSRRSLYHLYAHLNRPSALTVGDPVTCGEVIGEVGTTGNSVNPHLHLETRLGPAGVTFASLGHYDTRTTEEERSNYCIWRVSGWFQMFDPMILLSQTP